MNGRERRGWSSRGVPSWTRWLAIGWTLLTLAWPLFPDVPFNPSDPYSMSSGWRPVIAAWYLGSASAPRPYRYARASGPVERQQTEWVVYGVTVAVLGWTAYTRAPDILPVLERPGMTRVLYRLVGGPIFACALLPIPLSLMVAILRYRPFDIDVVVNRTLVYGSLTAVLALVYSGSVVLLQGTFLALTGQGSQLAVVASTLMIAALCSTLCAIGCRRSWIAASIAATTTPPRPSRSSRPGSGTRRTSTGWATNWWVWSGRRCSPPTSRCEEAFAAAWTAGGQLSLEQAVAEAQPVAIDAGQAAYAEPAPAPTSLWAL
jgi:hypothetical protein